MRQGMDRGKQHPVRRGTSRVAKPATGRMNAQQPGTSRRDAQQDGRGAPPPQEQDKTMLYVGIGGGAVVLIIVMALMLGGGSEHKSGGAGGDTIVNRAIAKATEAYSRSEYREGLNICETALSDPKARRSSRYKNLQDMAANFRKIIDHDKIAQEKVGEFKRRIEGHKADQTAMAKANDLMVECNRLLSEFGTTPSGKDLRGIKEDLGRWVSTEGQGNWQ